MSSELALHFGGIFLSYSLQVVAAYLGCLALTRLMRKPQHRFVAWMSFLLAVAAYWLFLGLSELQAMMAPAATLVGNARPGLSALNRGFTVPMGWDRAILVSAKIFAVVYVASLIFLVGVAVLRHLRLRVFLRQGRPAPEALVRLFEETRAGVGVPWCELAVFSALNSPATAGWLRPRILLPGMCEELGAAPQVADALYHELVHVARRDYLWAGIGDLICRLVFFHPVVWYAQKAMRMQGELACDLAVIESKPGHRADYAESLAAFVRMRMIADQATVGIDFAAGSSLGTRIRFILSEPRPGRWWNRTARAAAAIAVMIALVAVAPALTIFLNFGSAVSRAVQATPLQNIARSGPLAVRAGHQRSAAAITEAARIHAQPWVPETSAFALSSSGGTSTGATEPASEMERPWRESPQAMRYPSVPNVLLSTAEIALGRSRDRDRDDHDKH